MSEENDKLIENLWKMHDTVGEWIRTADQKAGIVLALVAGIAALVVSQVSDLEGHLSAKQTLTIAIWGCCTTVAALHAASAVFPRLDTSEQQDTYILLGLLTKAHRIACVLANSLFPRSLLPAWLRPTDTAPALSETSALFFGTLAHADPRKVVSTYSMMISSPDLFAEAIASQIRATSNIAADKFARIRFSMVWFMLSIVGLVIFEILLLAE